MKKIVLSMAVAVVAVAFAVSAFAADVEEKTTVTTKGDTTVEKTEVKGGGIKAKETVTTTPESVTTKQELKGKSGKMERTEVETAEGYAGQTKVDVKKGALKDFNVEWAYYQKGTEYIIEYTVKDKTDPELLQALNLTAAQTNALKPGLHTITSTSPYTAGDVQANFRQIIVKDLASSLQK